MKQAAHPPPASSTAAKAPPANAATARRLAPPRSMAARGEFSKISPEQHVIAILRGAERRQYAPLDAHVRAYFFQNKDILRPPKLRREISSKVYNLTTWRGLLDHVVDPSGLKYVSWDERLETLKKINVKEKMNDPNLPCTSNRTSPTFSWHLTNNKNFSVHVRCSFPKPLVDQLLQEHSREGILDIARGSNFGAPLTIRANATKISRDELLRKLKEKHSFQLKPCDLSPLGITFVVKPLEPLHNLPEFQEGLFEIQDEASQVAALLVDPLPGQQVLDFCAGSGGKTLAFAHKLKGKGGVHLHDIPHLLRDAKRRLARAGVQNAEFYSLDETAGDEEDEEQVDVDEIDHEDAPLEGTQKKSNKKASKHNDDEEEAEDSESEKKHTIPRSIVGVYKNLQVLAANMDWVLADVPCSGTGVYRRNPDMRWRYSEEALTRLLELQRRIASTAAKFVVPGGHLVYTTCSILKAENDDQVASLIKSENLELVKEPFRSYPQQGGMDGFFGAVLRKK